MPTIQKDATKLAEAMRESERSQEFWSQHWREYVRRYPERFVAVRKDGEVVTANTDLAMLYYDLRDRGLSMRDVWIEFVSERPRNTNY